MIAAIPWFILLPAVGIGVVALFIILVTALGYLEAREMRKRDYHDLKPK